MLFLERKSKGSSKKTHKKFQYVAIIGNFKRFRYFDFEVDFLKNNNLFQRTGVLFYLKPLRLKTHHFHTKLPYQKPKN